MGTEVLSKIQKPKQRPSNQDILSAARSACCRLSLETSIEAKFGVLPRRIYLKAAKLCGEHGVKVQWHLKGYICSNGSMEASDNGLEVDECHCIMEAHHFSKRGFGKTTVLCSDISFEGATLVWLSWFVVVESMESLLAHIGLYASTDIAAGEEITRDYERKPVTSGQENEHSCHCRATNCRNHFC
ncbi:hypothetical protein HID58_082971 [Brassica napus]|uniref:SET domain-containing protein n=1 Tax=Brassica napus TaxID=3708 RepID=A0ABQ7YC47_BRANA|nr:hypothetical protein HID58_082971 [Brassica napus]